MSPPASLKSSLAQGSPKKASAYFLNRLLKNREANIDLPEKACDRGLQVPCR